MGRRPAPSRRSRERQPKQERLKGRAFIDAWREAHKMGLVPDPPPDKGNRGSQRIRAVYPYTDETGAPLFEVVRFDTTNPDKRFRQRRSNGSGGWIWDLKGVRIHVLYRLPALIEAVKAGQRALICEGEHDADTAVALGFVATTMPGGVNKWRAEYDEVFRDRNADIVIVSDNDEQAKDENTGALKVHPDGRPELPGQDHATKLAKRLCKVAAHLRVVIPPKKDLSEWIAAGGDRAAVDALIDATPDLIKEPPSAPTRTLESDGRPEFEVDSAWPDRAVTALRDILSERAELFERGVPVRVAVDQAAGGSVAHELSAESLILEAHFVSRPFVMVPNDDGEGEHPEPVQFPLIMSKMYLGWRGEWRLQPLNGITTAPILSDDGGIRTAHGYDKATGLWCENIPDVTELIPAKPTIADAKAALAVIREDLLLCRRRHGSRQQPRRR
jgi:hypothetical protein